jgi:hypothetical protein
MQVANTGETGTCLYWSAFYLREMLQLPPDYANFKDFTLQDHLAHPESAELAQSRLTAINEGPDEDH